MVILFDDFFTDGTGRNTPYAKRNCDGDCLLVKTQIGECYIIE